MTQEFPPNARPDGSGLLILLADMGAEVLAIRCGLATQDLADSVSDMSKSNDWFLVAPDFTDYMRAQVSPCVRLAQLFEMLSVLVYSGMGGTGSRNQCISKQAMIVIIHACKPLTLDEQGVSLHSV